MDIRVKKNEIGKSLRNKAKCFHGHLGIVNALCWVRTFSSVTIIFARMNFPPDQEKTNNLVEMTSQTKQTVEIKSQTQTSKILNYI